MGNKRLQSWMLSIPRILREAIEAIAPDVWPESGDQFLVWVNNGLPPIKMRCGYRNGESAYGGVMHQVLIIGTKIETPGHRGDGREPAGIRNACLAAAVALQSSGPLPNQSVTRHSDRNGNTRSMPFGQIGRLEKMRTVWLAAKWLRAGKSLASIAPLLRHGPGPDQAIPLLASGISANRLAEWAGHDLYQCAFWVGHPEVSVDLAESLLHAGLGPVDVARWKEKGVPARNLSKWLKLSAAKRVAESEIPAWEAAGVAPDIYTRVTKLEGERRLKLAQYLEWNSVGIPADHIRVYEYARVRPSEVAPYSKVLAQHDPWEVVRAMGLLTDSEAQVPLNVIVKYLKRDFVPYTAVFFHGRDYPLTEAVRRRAVDAPNACFDRQKPPRISWSAAENVVRKGSSFGSFFTLPSLLTSPAVPLVGAHHNSHRIRELFSGTPVGQDQRRLPWTVGILYMAPRDLVYNLDGLIGVMTQTGHVGCLQYGYFYLRSFIEALNQHGIHFVVPIVKTSDDHDDDIAVRFLRYRELRPLLERLKPSGIDWEWPPWQPSQELPSL